MLIGQTNDVKFKVNVMGTSAEATARVILCTNPQLSFPATKIGDDWTASVTVPEAIEPGSYDMKVEVMVGNRHFTPLTKKLELFGRNQIAAAVEEPVATEEAAEPIAEPAKEVVAPEAVAEAPVEAVTPSLSLIKSFDAAPAVEEPEAPKKITLPKDFFKFEGKKVAPVKIEFKPLDSMLSFTTIDRPLTPGSVKPVLEINHGTPVRLIKGEIIYE